MIISGLSEVPREKKSMRFAVWTALLALAPPAGAQDFWSHWGDLAGSSTRRGARST
jgi:hypothetical protein